MKLLHVEHLIYKRTFQIIILFNVQSPCDLVNINMIFLLDLWKLSVKGFKQLTQGHTEGKRKSWSLIPDLNPVIPSCIFSLFNLLF